MANNVTYQAVKYATVPSQTKIKTTEGADGHVQHVNVDDIPALTSADVVTVTGGAGQTADVKVTLDTEAVAISGTVAVTDNSGSITVDDGASSLTVDGTVAVSGTVAVTDNSGSLTVDDGSGSLTVDGTVTNKPYGLAVSQGLVSGASTWSKTGYNGDVDTGTEHVWAVGGTFVFPPSAMQMEVISSSDDDAAAGTGVQKVIITYLDNTYAEQTETVTLTGTTAKATVATNILRVNNFRAFTVGTGKVAAGNIDIRETDDSPIYSRIATGFTRARNSAYTVPLAKALYITAARFSAISNVTGGDVLFTVRASYDDKRAAVLDFMMPIIELGVQDGSSVLDFNDATPPIKLPATVDITITAQSGNNNVIVSSILRGFLETA